MQSGNGAGLGNVFDDSSDEEEATAGGGGGDEEEEGNDDDDDQDIASPVKRKGRGSKGGGGGRKRKAVGATKRRNMFIDDAAEEDDDEVSCRGPLCRTTRGAGSGEAAVVRVRRVATVCPMKQCRHAMQARKVIPLMQRDGGTLSPTLRP